MSSNSRYICRLCFGIDDISGGEIEDIHKEILDILLINIDWSLTETPTLCANCCKKLHESFTFKANCIDIEDYLTPMKDNGKLDLREVCSLPKHSNAVDLICRLCVEWVDDQEVTLTEIEKERFKLYLPEIDLESTSNPVICSVCYDSFKSCLSFTESCIQNEQKLVDYCKKLKMTIESPIFLNEFLEYQESPNSSTRVCHLNRKVKSEKLDEYKCDNCSYTSISVTDIEAHKVSHVNSCQQHDFDADLKICIKEEYISELDSKVKSEKLDEYKCDICSYTSISVTDIEAHKVSHVNSSQQHDFDADLKIFIKEEYISELANRTQECSPYNFETSDEWGLDRHIIGMDHKNSNVEEEKTVYIPQKTLVCSICDYQTSRPSNLKQHMVKHLDTPSFKCDECSFESKWAHSLSNHKIIHRNPSEVDMFKCEECPFESKWSTSLISHKKIHRKPSEVNVFKCDECPYECKRNDRLSDHKKKHREPSELNMFKCEECPFESKRAHNLSVHKKMHRKPSEVNMFKCDECPFESKWAGSLTSHKIIHRKPSEMKIFKCDECPFESKWAKSLICHEKIHLKPSEVNMFKCDECPFESKWANSLNNHKQIHRKPSEVNIDG